MCDICNGMSFEESRRRTIDTIEREGWVVQHVGAATDRAGPHWSYTIGLLEHYGHPELVMVDIERPLTHAVINAVADRVRGGERFAAGDTVELYDGFQVQLSAVHPAHEQHGGFNGWLDVYRFMPDARFQGLEVVLPPQCFCENHRHRGPQLAGARPVIGRVAGRARARGNRRRRNSRGRGRR